MRYRSTGRCLAAVMLAALAGVGLALFAVRRDETAQPVIVDEQAGTLHGIRFGDSEREVVARLGEEADDRPGYFPAGADYTGPGAIPSPVTDRGSRILPSELHYDASAYLVSLTAGVFSMVTLEGGARTLAGVGVGDDLELVRGPYEDVRCGEAIAGEPLFGGETPTYPWCRALVGDTSLFFGEDPIESITLTRYEQ